MTIKIRDINYELGVFGELHLIPLASFITDGLKTSLSWYPAARALMKILPGLPISLVICDSENPGEADILLTAKELYDIYLLAVTTISESGKTDNRSKQEKEKDLLTQLEKLRE